MKNVRKFVGAFLVAAFFCACFLPFHAFAAECTVSASGVSGKTGDTVSITVSISSVSAASFQVFASFNSSELEFVSVTKGNAGNNLMQSDANRTGSQVRYAAFDAENAAVGGTVMTIRFKILASSGSSSITLTAAVYDESGSKIPTNTSNGQVTVSSSGGSDANEPSGGNTNPDNNPSGGSSSITQASKSSDATLKSLVVKGVTKSGYTTAVVLSPSFSASRTSYSASVAADVERLAVTAVANDGKAKVSVPSGYLRMDVGNNITKVIVTAQDGTQKTYTIKTVKAATGASVTEPITDELYTQALTEPPTEPESVTLAEPESVEETTTLPPDSEAQETTALSSENSNGNALYIKLGVVFGVAAFIVFGVSVALFINEGRKKARGEHK